MKKKVRRSNDVNKEGRDNGEGGKGEDMAEVLKVELVMKNDWKK